MTLLTLHLHAGDRLDVRHFSIHERISTLFEVRIVAVSSDLHLALDGIVG